MTARKVRNDIMKPIAQLSQLSASRVDYVFADIDDTLTTDGRLSAASYKALEDLSDAGIQIVPVTGRPAGWCDLIARFWPVAGVVGENGAFFFSYDHKTPSMRRVFASSQETRLENRKRLAEIRDRVLTEVPGAAVSSVTVSPPGVVTVTGPTFCCCSINYFNFKFSFVHCW